MPFFQRPRNSYRQGFLWLRILTAALGLAAVAFGFWAAATATKEEIQRNNASAQLLAVADIAARARLNPLAVREDSMAELFRKLETANTKVPLNTVVDDANPPGFLLNVWGERLDFNLTAIPTGNPLQPAGLLLDLTSNMPALACRDVLGDVPVGVNYTDTAIKIELWQIEVSEPQGRSARQLYSKSQTNTYLLPEAIRVACGVSAMVKVRVTFRLFS